MIVHLNNKPVKTHVDSGSVVTLVTKCFANKHKLTVTPTNYPAITKLLSANTGDIDIIGTTEFVVKISGLSLPVSARVARVLNIDFLVGVDFLQAYEAKLDYQTGLMSLSDDLVRAPLLSDSKPDNLATCIQSVYIRLANSGFGHSGTRTPPFPSSPLPPFPLPSLLPFPRGPRPLNQLGGLGNTVSSPVVSGAKPQPANDLVHI